MSIGSKTILVQKTGGKEFKIEVPENSSLTFGPFSPPTKSAGYDREGLKGTLRVYAGAKATATKIIAVFTDVVSFRELSSINYSEKVAVEEGATVWKNDRDGYARVEKVNRTEAWDDEPAPRLEANVISDVSDAAEDLF